MMSLGAHGSAPYPVLVPVRFASYPERLFHFLPRLGGTAVLRLHMTTRNARWIAETRQPR